MADHRRSSQDRKLTLVGPLAALVVIAVVVIGVIALSHRAPDRPPPPQAPAPAPLPAADAPQAPPPALTRNELIQTEVAYAAGFAAGELPPRAASPLLGRKFSVRIPFGCDGPTVGPTSGPAAVEFDAKNQILKISARPTNLTALPLVQALADAGKIEAVEGFWLPRPWTKAEGCPPSQDRPPPATPTPPAAQTIALAQFYPTDGSRVQRRGDRAYEAVRKIKPEDTALLTHPYALLLEGRIVGYPDRRAMRCWAESADHRPICVYRVEFDHVAFEDAVDGTLVAEWRD